MGDATFREAKKPSTEPKKAENVAAEETTQSIIKEEVPYTEYASEHGHPYAVEYFELGDNWDVFNEEVATIDHYIKRMIKSGDMASDVKTIEREMKRIEKLNNVKDESRPVVKIGIISSYIKFLNEVDGIKVNYKKYAY